jgi:hypothetical protein
MSHFILLITCIISVEVFIRLNFLSILDSILQVTRKVTFVIPADNISDHWKEKVVPAYALKIMKYSSQIFLILLIMLSLFFVADSLRNGFLEYTLSLMGIIESILFAWGYIYFRKSLIK